MGHDGSGPDFPTIRNVLILGASGTLGAPTLQQLSRAGFQVTILTRPDSSATFPPGFNVVHAAYSDKIALSMALQNQDAVVFALGHVPPEIEPLLVDVAADAGVKRFILGEFGFDSHNKAALEINPIVGRKQSVYKYAQTKTSLGMSWTALVTGPFFDLSVKTGFFDINAQDRTAILYDAGDREATVNTSTVDTISRAIVAILQKPNETANRHMYISSFAMTGSQLVRAYEQVLGGRQFVVSNASTIELEKQGKQKLANGDMSGVGDLLKVNVWRKGGGCDYGSYRALDNELLELPVENMQETIAKALKS